MRSRTGVLVNRSLQTITGICALLFMIGAMFAGCGGGGDGGGSANPTPTPTPTPSPAPAQRAGFRVQIDWGARSRVGGLSSALSARIRLIGAKPGGGDIVWTVERPAGTAAIRQVYDAPEQAIVGNWILDVRFFSSASAGGAEVGFAQASATVTADGALTVTISTYEGLKSIRIIPGQSVAVGEVKELAFEALNYKGENVALSLTPGSVVYSIVSGTANVALENGTSSVRGVRPTQASLTLAVDGTTSLAETIAVTSTTALAVDPTSATIGSQFSLDLTGTVTSAPETDVTFTLESGTDMGTLTQTSPTTATYVAPKVTGDTVRTISITVSSNYDSVKKIVVPVTVKKVATVEVTPKNATLSYEQAQAFTATLANLPPSLAADSPDRGVTWTVYGPSGEENKGNRYGKITSEGIYTAPKLEGTFLVEAVSNYDGSVKQRVPIVVVSKVGVVITPSNPAPLAWEDALPLTAAVLETPNQQVVWKIDSPTGFETALTTTGPSTATFKAPKKNGTYVVRATSTYDNRKFATVTITVSTNIGVTVTPNTPDPFLISINGKQLFTRSLTGLPPNRDDTVTWSVVGPDDEENVGNRYGTITAEGLYTAPPTVFGDGRCKVVATSNYDTAAVGIARVKVVAGSIGVGVK